MGVVGSAFLIVGSTIGAGFITGAELVRFFAREGFLPAYLASCVLFFGICALYLTLGKKYGGYDGVLAALFGKFSSAVRLCALLCIFVPCGGMLAGLDSLFPAAKPLISCLSLAAAWGLVHRGMKGVYVLNLVLVPLLILFVFCGARGGLVLSWSLPRGFSGFLGLFYAGMNSFLVAPVLMDLGKSAIYPKSSALCASLLVAVCGLCILGRVYGAGSDAAEAEMPYLAVMGNSRLFFVAVGGAVFTSLVSSLYPLLGACGKIGGKSKKSGKKRYAAEGGVLLAAFLFSRLGLSGIVSLFYPVVGGVGLLFSVLCVFHEYFFEKHHKEVHPGGEQTQDQRRAHHKVELKHLPAVHDEVPEPRFGDDILAHDGADPRHADRHFEHGDEGGKGGGDHEFI